LINTVSEVGDYTFPRESRLLTPAHFSNVFADATPAPSKYVTLLAKINPELSNSRLGITIAKNRVRKAHDRNRLKRVIRENFRLHQHFLPNIDIIVIGKSNLDTLSNQEFNDLLNKLWIKLKARCEK
jgi:ribonuclease P protein component